MIAGPGPGAGGPVSKKNLNDGSLKTRKLTHNLMSCIHEHAGNEDHRCDFLISMCKEPASDEILTTCTDKKEIIKECLFGPVEGKRESLYEGDPNRVLIHKGEFDERVSVTRDDYAKVFTETYVTLPKHTNSLFFMLEVQKRPRLWKMLPIIFNLYYLQTFEAKTESEIKSIATEDFTCDNTINIPYNPHLGSALWRKTRVCLLVARAMKKVILGYYIKLQSKPSMYTVAGGDKFTLFFCENKKTTSAEVDDDDHDFGQLIVTYSLADDYSFKSIEIMHHLGMHNLSEDNNNNPVKDVADKEMFDTNVDGDRIPFPFKIIKSDEGHEFPYGVIWNNSKKLEIATFSFLTCFDAATKKISLTEFSVKTYDLDESFPIEVDISDSEKINDIRAVKLGKRLVENLISTVAPLSLARSMDT